VGCDGTGDEVAESELKLSWKFKVKGSENGVAISKECLGLAAEYAAASELCRRGIYAQLTLGNRKRTDLLVDADAGTMFRIQVKAKQGREWPGVKGVHGESIALILVDYEKKSEAQRPDFYILLPTDWANVLEKLVFDLGHVKSGKATISDDSNLARRLCRLRHTIQRCARTPRSLG
jgi:hypothetical protein